MEAKELMVGDLVYYKYSSPEKWQPRQWRICAFEGDFIELADPKTSCKPIPLTSEILVKNANGGWCNFDESRSIYHIHRDKQEVSIYVEWEFIRREPYIELDGLGDTLFKGYCATIHELQHALRLCGLTELADNLVI